MTSIVDSRSRNKKGTCLGNRSLYTTTS